jgi:hypothetical protein
MNRGGIMGGIGGALICILTRAPMEALFGRGGFTLSVILFPAITGYIVGRYL